MTPLKRRHVYLLKWTNRLTSLQMHQYVLSPFQVDPRWAAAFKWSVNTIRKIYRRGGFLGSLYWIISCKFDLMCQILHLFQCFVQNALVAANTNALSWQWLFFMLKISRLSDVVRSSSWASLSVKERPRTYLSTVTNLEGVKVFFS